MSPTSEDKKLDNLQDSSFICGVVEGFYGRPWTTEQRKDLFTKLQVRLEQYQMSQQVFVKIFNLQSEIENGQFFCPKKLSN